MNIRLLVIRTPDPKKLSDFYSLLGIDFAYHQHDRSSFHYSAGIGTAVFEIYPLAAGQEAADKNLRLGFSVDNFEAVATGLLERGIITSTTSIQTGYGEILVVTDPDGRKVELYKA